MTQDTTATEVATINMDMLSNPTDGNVTESVMSQIHTLKVYNPRPGDAADPEKAGKFIIKTAGSGEQKVVDGPISYNVLSVLEAMSGECYPFDAQGNTMLDPVYFTTNEYSRYTRAVEPIGLRGGNKVVGWFPKGELNEMIRAKILNGEMNPFYEAGKTKEGKPYDSSKLSRVSVVYGKFTDGPFKDEYFRTFVKPSYFGITYRDGAVCDAEEGTFLAAIAKALGEFNKVREANGMSKVKSLSENQVIVKHSIVKNERGNFLTKFDYGMLQLQTGESNQDDVDYIHGLQKEHLNSTFGEITPVQSIEINGGKATLAAVNQDYDTKRIGSVESSAETEEISIADAEAAFATPGQSNSAPVGGEGNPPY